MWHKMCSLERKVSNSIILLSYMAYNTVLLCPGRSMIMLDSGDKESASVVFCSGMYILL